MHAWLVILASALAFAAAAIEPPQPAAAAQGAPAQEPAPEEQPPPAEATPAEKETKAPAETEGDEELPPLPPDTGPAAPPPQKFNPTEKVRADFPVSFPIDI